MVYHGGGLHCLVVHSEISSRAQETINEEVRRDPILLMGVPDHFKKHKMCEEAVEAYPWLLYHVPLHFRMQEMYEKAVENHYPYILFLIILGPKGYVIRW